MATLADMLIKVSADVSSLHSGLQRGIQDVQGFENKTQSSFTRIGHAIQNGFGFAVGFSAFQGIRNGIIGATSAAINFDSQMQQNDIAFSSMLGSASKAKTMMADLYNFASTTPFEMTQVESASKMMLGMGWQANQIIPTLTKIGDAASGLGLGAEGINRIVLALGQMRAHGTADAGDILQLSQAGIPVWNMLADAMGKPIPVIQKMVSNGLIPANQAINIITDGMEKRFPHMMDAQSKSFSGLMSTLHDNVVSVFGKVMQPLFDKATTTWLPKLIDLTTKFSNAVQSGGISAGFKAILPPAVFNAISTGLTIIKDSFLFITNHGPLIVAVLSAIGTALLIFKVASIINGVVGALKSMQTAMALLNITMDANPIGLIVIAIAALVGLAVLIVMHWKDIGKFFSNLWKGVEHVTSAAWHGIQAFFKSLMPILIDIIIGPIGMLVRFIINHWTQIKNDAVKLWNAITSGIVNIWNGFVNFIKGVVQDFVQGIVNAFSWLYDHNYYFKNLVDSIVGFFNYLKNMATRIWHDITAFLAGVWNGIVHVATTIWNTLKRWFEDFLNAEIRGFTNIWNMIKRVLEAVWNGIVRAVRTIFGPIINFFSGIWNGIHNGVSRAWGAITGAIGGAARNAWNAVTGVFNGAGKFFTGLWHNAVGWGENMIHGFTQGIKNKIQEVANAAHNIMSKVSGFLGFHSPSKEGPGRDIILWGQNMIGGFVDGINKAVPNLRATMNKVLVPPMSVARQHTMNYNRVSRRFAGGGSGPLIHIEHMHVRSESDIQKVSEQLYRMKQNKLRSSGLGATI